VGDLRKEIANGFRQQHSKRREYQINDGIKAMMANGKVF
jgi:glucose-1-phosphate thymidylyltransferase